MAEWKEYKLGALIESANTGLDAIKRAPIVFYDSGIKCLRIQDVSQKKAFQDWGFCEVTNDNYKRFQLKKGDIIIARTGETIGVNLLIRDDLASVFNNGLIRIRVNLKKTSPSYIFYQFQSPRYRSYIESISGGTSTQPNMQINALLDFDIKIPPLPEQQVIAEVLSGLDDKIDLLQRQNKTLEALARTLFRQWFVNEASKGWKEVLLKDIYSFEKGIEPGSSKYIDSPTPNSIRFIRVGDMNDRRAAVFIKAELLEGKLCNRNDLLISLDGTVGRVVFGIEGYYSSGIRKISSEDPVLDSLWLKHLIFSSKEIQDEINAHATGTVILHAGSSINYLSMKLPNNMKLKEYDEVFNPIYFKISNNLLKLDMLTQLRGALLPKLMNGEVRVNTAKAETAIASQDE